MKLGTQQRVFTKLDEYSGKSIFEERRLLIANDLFAECLRQCFLNFKGTTPWNIYGQQFNFT